MHLVTLDTCVWLDLATQKAEMPMLAAIENLVRDGCIKILLPDLVRAEFERNKERVIDATRRRLSTEFRVVKGAIESFAGDGKGAALEALDDLNLRLPILSEATHSTSNRVLKLFDTALEIPISDTAKIRAAERAIAKKAPFHRQKNSGADAVLAEAFHEFRTAHAGEYDTFRFVTHNVTDFSAKDHRKPHEDLVDMFDGTDSFYFSSTSLAIEDLLDLDEFHYEYGFAWEDETRGRQEIMSALDELFDKVWYNRHMNLMYHIENGDVEIVPAGTTRYGNDLSTRMF
jgi:hypothetical protein